MNLSKTQVMFNELVDAQDQIIEIEGTQLKVVESYTYLGQLVTFDPSKQKKVNRRISFGWQAFG